MHRINQLLLKRRKGKCGSVHLFLTVYHRITSHSNNHLLCFCSSFHRIPDTIRNHLDTKNRRLSVCNCEISIFIYGCLFSIPTVDVIRGFFVIHIHINRTRRHICKAKRFSDKPGKGFFPGCLDQLRIFFQGYILLIARSDQCCTSASPVRKGKNFCLLLICQIQSVIPVKSDIFSIAGNINIR